jgi:hypothetical protein
VTRPTDDEIRVAIAEIRKDEMKQALTDALREWLNQQLATFGWWTAKGLASLGLAALVALILWKTGFNK